MNPPVSPAAPLRVSPGPAGSVDEDAALTVDQVSDRPPEVAPALAAACRDALLQAAPCPLLAQERAGLRSPPPRQLPRPRTSSPRSLGRPASRLPRPAPGARLPSGSLPLAKGELVSLEGGPLVRDELLAASCTERGPRLVLSGRVPEVIEDPLDEFFDGDVEIDLSPAPPRSTAPRATPRPPPVPPPPPSRRDLTPSPSIPIVLSEAPPAASERPALPRRKPALTPAPPASTGSLAPSSRSSPASPASPSSLSSTALSLSSDVPAPSSPDAPASSASPSSPSPSSSASTSTTGASRPIAFISDFDEPLALDPRQAAKIPRRPPPARPKRLLHPKAVALFGGLFGLAAVGTLLTFAIRLGTPPTKAPAAAKATASSAAPPASAAPEPPPEPGPWRVAALSGEEGVKMVTGKLGTRSLMAALEEDHLPKAQIFRILKAFDDPKLFDKPRKSHQFTVALDRASKRVRGFEYQASSTEVWQAREVEDGRLAGTKLDLKVEQRPVSKGVIVDGSLKASLVEAGLNEDMVGLLDDALNDRLTLDRLGKGTSLRIVAQEQLVAGRFSKYLSLDAVEYQLPRADKRVRLYHFRNGKIAGVFDSGGKAPYRTSWGPPLKVVRITSKFNPKRLHPVLHTVMPHNGTDFGAPMGTPVYAVAAGTIGHLGPQGPSGNLVLVEHANGLESGYAHLSRFAPGLKKGDKVEPQQLVGYVGSTGRSTGPHLHFSIKKNGAYIDAMTIIKLNQERVLPKSDREAFDAFRAEMDKLLDAIPLADRPAVDGPGDPDEGEHRDENNHGEEHEGPAASAAPGASAAPDSSKPEPPAAPPVTDDTSPESAVWRPD